MYITNCEIGLHSVNMIDTNIDVGVFKYDNGKVHRADLANALMRNLEEKPNMNGVSFTSESVSSSVDYKAINSEGSLVVTRGKVYVVYSQLPSLTVDEKYFIKNCNDEELAEFRRVIMPLKSKEFQIQEPELKFGAFGEVIFFTHIPIVDEYIDLNQYKDICKFLFKFVRNYYLTIVIDVCNIYVDTLLALQNERSNKLRLTEVFHSSIFNDKGEVDYKEIGRRCFHSFSWSHYIFDEKVYEYDDNIEVFSKVAEYDTALSKENQKRYNNSKVSLGWSHSFFFTKNLNEIERNEYVQFNKIPIELEWGEWEFLRNLNQKVEKSLYQSYDKLDNRSLFFTRIGAYNKKVNRFYFYARRIIESYEGITLTVNPVQLELKEIQRGLWKLDTAKNEFEEKLDSLRLIIEHLRDLKRDFNSRILNGILFIIALLSVVDISNTIYNILSTNNNEYIMATIIPASSTLVVAMLIYRILKE